MDDQQVARYWDENAAEWVRGVRAGWDVYRDYVNNPAFFGMLPDLRGRRVLDVGCGEGYNTEKLADFGARVIGIDISVGMIAAAREQEAERPRGIEYHVASGNDLSAFADASFDGVVSTMALMDMADYAGCVREVARVLKPGGHFQFSISHPGMLTRRWRWVKDQRGERHGVVVGNYFSLLPAAPEEDVEEWQFTAAPPEQRAHTRPFRIPRFFRTFGEYVNTLTGAGFEITRVLEPHADEAAVQACPAVADTRIVPFFLILQCHLRRGSETKP